MSVYTSVSDLELAQFLRDYDLGGARALTGISAGVENSNYFLDTEKGHFVLTLFERLPRSKIPYFLDLTEWLSLRGIPCPRPMHTLAGNSLSTLCGKPAAIVQRLRGTSIEGRAPSVAEISALGTLLARMHLAGEGFPERHPNPAGFSWWQETARHLVPHLSREDNALIAEELAYQGTRDRTNLPGGVVHADLFPDNVLFENGRISGTIDFYYAGDDVWLYDLAVVANAWCSETDGHFAPVLLRALWDAYVATRPLQAGEEVLWFPLLRAAALRFWLLRLDAIHFRRPGTITQCKDPEEYRQILLQRRRLV
ncbi:MAG: homoserine kinase [Acidithiobacillus ferriphilus]|jgi:homoserine kinase (EC 2.7.1.39)|uniref:Homoserine kinase n=3 Tax=Acidithiobacillus TaxID=119977 RepID=A0A179BMV1_ACIFR|nr:MULTISPECIES: homoserine kinase [Acidithiobacillus]OYV82430.1 MAG: homoserine kinase [Acidithiobacillus ferrivorans]MBU2784899.1 homoserine kinase [Acidithiobacillus ferriphilus]MBU2827796.1 homoserine kinase [Acidithiobacillus ferriphilus]MBU2829526.1 homoserine kinase [Acidithiobacillus ferriphilus]MBU2833959.1 homoserine kinase [Acidithiobacillus ferriphilus]